MNKRGGSALRSGMAMALVLVGLSPAVSTASGYQRPGANELVNVSTSGEQAKFLAPTFAPTDCMSLGRSFQRLEMSYSGRYIAFASGAANLVDNDTNLMCDVFVRDLINRTTERVSVSSTGALQARGTSDLAQASISADGRYVAFASTAINLTPGDTDIYSDVFLHDRRTQRTRLVSGSYDGVPADNHSASPSISGDGRYVAFESRAGNLVEGDTPSDSTPTYDIFVFDRKAKKTERISMTESGAEPNGDSSAPSMSFDGRYVSFASQAIDIHPLDGDPGNDVYVHDRVTHETELVNLTPAGDRARNVGAGLTIENADVSRYAGRSLSADGRYVVFESGAGTLVPNDPGSRDNPAQAIADADLFVRDRKTGRTRRVTVTSAAEEIPHKAGLAGSISPDGRYVTFSAQMPNTSESEYSAYLYDLRTGAAELISVPLEGQDSQKCFDASGLEHKPRSFEGTISNKGRYVLFLSCASDLVANDDDSYWNSFVRDRGGPIFAGNGGGRSKEGADSQEAICVTPEACIPSEICVSPEVCIPPNGFAQEKDPSEGDMAMGSDLIEASIAYRPQERDLLVAIELKSMPSVNAATMMIPGIPSTIYGVSFSTIHNAYEVRATSLSGGSFGLFRCSRHPARACSLVATLRGGYGTTGERIVVSLPLEGIDLSAGGKLFDVEAFSAFGTFYTGASTIFDSLRIN